MNKLKIGFGIAVVVLLVVIVFVIAFNPVKNAVQKLGNLNVNENAYSGAATYATSSVGATAVSLVPKATSSRTYASVCPSTSNGRVWIYKQATSTGIVTGMGTPIYASTTTGVGVTNCFKVNADDPYLGEIWGIGETTTSTVSVEYLQN